MSGTRPGQGGNVSREAARRQRPELPTTWVGRSAAAGGLLGVALGAGGGLIGWLPREYRAVPLETYLAVLGFSFGIYGLLGGVCFGLIADALRRRRSRR